MISLVETQTAGLELVQVPPLPHRHSVVVAFLEVSLPEDLCSRKKSPLRSYLTVSSEVVALLPVASALSVSHDWSDAMPSFNTPAGGPQFVFNMGGGPGFRVHQFGGQGPRRRPQEATNGQSEPRPSGWSSLTQLLPLILLFVLPLLSSLFSGGSSTPSGPSFRFDGPVTPHTHHRTTPKLRVDYYLNPREIDEYNAKKFFQLDQRVELEYVSTLRYECDNEVRTQEQMIQDAQGWFFPDMEKMKEARAMELKSCRKLDSLKGRTRY